MITIDLTDLTYQGKSLYSRGIYIMDYKQFSLNKLKKAVDKYVIIINFNIKNKKEFNKGRIFYERLYEICKKTNLFSNIAVRFIPMTKKQFVKYVEHCLFNDNFPWFCPTGYDRGKIDT